MLQRPDQAMQPLRIRLRLRDDNGRWPLVVSPRGQVSEGAIAYRRVALEPRAAILRGVEEERPARRRLITHDVGVRPLPARPDRRHVPRRDARIEAALGTQLVEGELDRRRETRTRRLGEQARAAIVVRVLRSQGAM